MPAAVRPKVHMLSIFLWQQPRAENETRAGEGAAFLEHSLPCYSCPLDSNSLVMSEENTLEEAPNLIFGS